MKPMLEAKLKLFEKNLFCQKKTKNAHKVTVINVRRTCRHKKARRVTTWNFRIEEKKTLQEGGKISQEDKYKNMLNKNNAPL